MNHAPRARAFRLPSCHEEHEEPERVATGITTLFLLPTSPSYSKVQYIILFCNVFCYTMCFVTCVMYFVIAPVVFEFFYQCVGSVLYLFIPLVFMSLFCDAHRHSSSTLLGECDSARAIAHIPQLLTFGCQVRLTWML